MKKLMTLFIKRLAIFGKSTLNEGKSIPKKSIQTLNITGFLPLILLFAPVASHATYVSTFIDNGDLVTEIRDYGSYTETWEWLDLTVTNGISYNSIVADLADDGALNNSSALTGYVNSILDVTGLTSGNQAGWSTVSEQGVVNLFNSYFGLSLADDQIYYYNSNVTIIEEFITAFGDTYHEGQFDYFNGLSGTDANITLENIGYSLGVSSTPMPSPIYNEAQIVIDGQYYYEEVDRRYDAVGVNNHAPLSVHQHTVGTWLHRSQGVVEVPEPDTFILFTLALMGLISGRFRQHLNC